MAEVGKSIRKWRSRGDSRGKMLDGAHGPPLLGGLTLGWGSSGLYEAQWPFNRCVCHRGDHQSSNLHENQAHMWTHMRPPAPAS